MVVSNMFYFHPNPWGNYAIWRAYFAEGLKPPTRFHVPSIHLSPPVILWCFFCQGLHLRKLCWDLVSATQHAAVWGPSEVIWWWQFGLIWWVKVMAVVWCGYFLLLQSCKLGFWLLQIQWSSLDTVFHLFGVYRTGRNNKYIAYIAVTMLMFCSHISHKPYPLHVESAHWGVWKCWQAQSVVRNRGSTSSNLGKGMENAAWGTTTPFLTSCCVRILNKIPCVHTWIYPPPKKTIITGILGITISSSYSSTSSILPSFLS